MMLLVIWWLILSAVTIFLAVRPNFPSPLLLAYFVGLSLIHVPGAVNYLGPVHVLNGEQETFVGFEATLIGITMLLVGTLFARRVGTRRTKNSLQQIASAAKSSKQLVANGVLMLTFGVVCYFVVLPLVAFVPSFTALASPIASLPVVGAWFLAYDGAIRWDRRQLLMLLVPLPLFPLATLALGGFAGFGVYWVISIVSFIYVFWRRRLVFLLAVPFIAYFGISLATVYFSERKGIRETVWVEKASMLDRLDRIAGIGRRFEWYDISDANDVYLVDGRLNQNFLVGCGILAHQRGQNELKMGGTVPAWALIPRAFWPGKPNVAGSENIVSEFTGIGFASGTSVGIGQPLEFYINFGWAGIVVGFFLWGVLLSGLDARLTSGLRDGSLKWVLAGGLPGLALLQPGGSLMEILVAFVASIIVARVIHMPLDKQLKRRQQKLRRLAQASDQLETG